MMLNHNVMRFAAGLPASVDWDDKQQELLDLADECSLAVLSIEEDAKHNGSRVAVIAASCKLRGSYANVCQMLHQLCQRDQPLWCEAIKMTRVSELENDTPLCEATLKLRIPFAGKDTLGANLVRSGQYHAG